MLLYRLANPLYSANPADWASGVGGLYGAARWHPRGYPIVYLAPTKANAVVEMAVQDGQLAIYDVLVFDIPDAVSRRDIEAGALSAGWRARTEYPQCQAIGKQWLTEVSETALLRVPSAPILGDFNFLLNPRHPDAQLIKVAKDGQLPMDARLIKSMR